MQRLLRLRKGGAVRRFHTFPVIGTQTVAEHSFNVALILLHITAPSRELLKAALEHDLAEYDTGDVPAPVKWKNPDLGELLHRIEFDIEWKLDLVHFQLSEDDRNWLKMADLLELIFFAIEQRLVGNLNMDLLVERVAPVLKAHPKFRECGEFVNSVLLYYDKLSNGRAFAAFA